MTLTTLPNQRHVLQVPCVVYRDPTGLDTEANYGTLVGITDGPVVVRTMFNTATFTKEPNGARPVKELFNGVWIEITMRLKAHSFEALNMAFPGMTDSDEVEDDVYIPGAAAGAGLTTGTDLVTNYAKQVLVMPIDECAVNPCALIQTGVARITDAAIMMSEDHDLTYEVLVRAYNSGTTSTYRNFFFGDKANATIL